MLFKRIECLGFKSFATKTDIELLPGISVVVGPNGCGKSNILDAIKWVLGEQSARQMRGKKMQDVIFSGSASFKPLGMAQVTLTLDNSRRLLDMDYNEIQVTRRLYRSGESEYLLNKVLCRRRDIHNLFLGTGVGTSAYSMLEQGRVDQIINAKASERRFIFEEAAGISKYRERKLEALRKLERTATDLHRLDDMVAEVQRLVNSLKRQAGKARRYREFTDELGQTERELFVLRSAGLREQMKSLEGGITELKDKAESIRARHARDAAAEQQTHARMDEVDGKLGEGNEELYQAKSRIGALEHESGRQSDRIEANGQRRNAIDGELSQLDARREELDRRRQELTGRQSEAEGELAGAQRRYDEHKADYDAFQTEVEAKKQLIEALSIELNQHRESVSRCENEIRMAEALIDRHEDGAREVESEIAGLREAIEGHQGATVELEARLGEIDVSLRERRDALAALQTRHAETHAGIAERTAALDRARRELHGCQARLATLLEFKAKFEGFGRGVREVMEEAGAERLAGVIGPLAEHVRVRADYETAIEAALGPHLQDIVVEDLAAGRRAAEFLVRTKQGRATFWPLDCRWDSAAPEELESVLAQSGVIGHGPATIEAEARFDPIVQALLADTVLVDTLATAERLAREEALALNYVSLDGQMIRSTHAVTGGVAQSAGLLGREREIEELTGDVARHEAREIELTGEIEAARAEAEALARQLEEGKRDLHGAEVNRVDLSKDGEAARRRLEEARQSLAQREGQLEKLRGEVASRREAIAENEAARARHAAGLDDAAARLEAERDRARAHGADVIRLGAELAQVHADVEKVRERLVHLEEGLRGLDREQSELQNDRAARESERTRLNEETEAARAEIETIKGQMSGLFERRTALEREVAEDQSERDRLHARIKELTAGLEQAQRDERIVENELHEKQLRQTEFQTNLNNLNDQAIEKFGAELGEIAAKIGEVERDAPTLAGEVAELREKIERIGPVNLAALEEFHEQNTRLEFLTEQREDLTTSKEQIEASIAAIDETTKRLFHETFESVRGHFIEMFRRLFNGGKADLIIDQEGDDPLLDGGVEIVAQPPGKKLQTLSLMSGGEKAMTAIALLFALFLHKPAPFAILDEIDAPLDDANVERFKKVVAEFARDTQFIIITHNKQTMELADVIYGVTMDESGVSRLVSVKFDQTDQYLTQAG